MHCFILLHSFALSFLFIILFIYRIGQLFISQKYIHFFAQSNSKWLLSTHTYRLCVLNNWITELADRLMGLYIDALKVINLLLLHNGKRVYLHTEVSMCIVLLHLLSTGRKTINISKWTNIHSKCFSHNVSS